MYKKNADLRQRELQQQLQLRLQRLQLKQKQQMLLSLSHSHSHSLSQSLSLSLRLSLTLTLTLTLSLSLSLSGSLSLSEALCLSLGLSLRLSLSQALSLSLLGSLSLFSPPLHVPPSHALFFPPFEPYPPSLLPLSLSPSLLRFQLELEAFSLSRLLACLLPPSISLPQYPPSSLAPEHSLDYKLSRSLALPRSLAPSLPNSSYSLARFEGRGGQR